MKALRMVVFVAVLAPISFTLVGLGCLVAYKGTVYFSLPEEMERILGNAPASQPPAVSTTPVSVPAQGTYVYQEHAPTPAINKPQAVTTPQQLRAEYYSRAGMSVQDVQNAIHDWNASENNRLLEQVQLGYYLALNCTHFQNGTVNEATARRYLEKTLARYQRIQPAPQVVHVERRSVRIPHGLSDYEQALFKTRQQSTDVDLYSEHEARRQQETAEAQRQHSARLEAEIQALRAEMRSRPSTDNSSEITDMQIQLRKLREAARDRPWKEGESYRNW